jgi:hypothetical protein
MASIVLSRYEAEEGDLPEVCMLCGAPATERKRRRFTSHPFWVYVLLPFGWLPYIIVAAILTVRVHCYTHLCARHRNHWLMRTLIIWGVFAGLVALILGSFFVVALTGQKLGKSSFDALFGTLCIGSLVLMFLWLASIPILQVTAIHPADVTKRRLTLKRISPEFADAVWEHRDERRAEAEQEDPPRGSPPRRPEQRRRPRPDPEEFDED